jgi:glycerol-3-phosphate acyltransferase PlsX
VTRSERATARIAVDLLGGDFAPDVVVDGALRAIGADPDLHLHLVGPRRAADGVLAALPAGDRDRVSVTLALGAAGMADGAVRAVRPDTTVRTAISAVACGRADGVVSAGSSAGVVTAAVVLLGRAHGQRKPALAVDLPGRDRPVMLLDVGACVDGGSALLVSHALLGARYARANRVAEPRVGLLSIGTERGKGDRLRRVTDTALRSTRWPVGTRYVGLVEPGDVALGGPADVVATDGFTGNILLKGIEGAYALAGRRPRDAAPPAALLLGVGGTVVVCHGAADAEDLAAGIALAARTHRMAVVARLDAGPTDVEDPE